MRTEMRRSLGERIDPAIKCQLEIFGNDFDAMIAP